MSLPPPLSTALTGLALGLALLAAIGPQNVFVLRQGLLGQHVRTVVALCVASDLVLITAIVVAAGVIHELPDVAFHAIRWGGVGYLSLFAVGAARRAFRSAGLEVSATDTERRRIAVRRTLALTWLNPHFYVDMLLVLGPLAASLGTGRYAFGVGVAVASMVWFVLIGVGARALRPLFRRSVTWRLLDGAVATTMLLLAVGLVRSGGP
jgi:L-lysine exporter family protein LysE/ArgO